MEQYAKQCTNTGGTLPTTRRVFLTCNNQVVWGRKSLLSEKLPVLRLVLGLVWGGVHEFHGLFFFAKGQTAHAAYAPSVYIIESMIS